MKWLVIVSVACNIARLPSVAEQGSWDRRFATNAGMRGPLISYQGEVYSSGAKWDGSRFAKWSGDEIVPYGFAAASNLLYVAGNRLPVSSQGKGVGVWNGTGWEALGNGLLQNDFGLFVAAVAILQDKLVAVGRFGSTDIMGTVPIAVWDGSSWGRFPSLPGEGQVENSELRCILATDDILYVGGAIAGLFERYYGIWAWNGVDWASLGAPSTTPAVFYSLVKGGTNLYVGGRFTSIAGVAAINVARWNGSNWGSLGEGIKGEVSSYVRALACRGTALYAAGEFTLAGRTLVNNIAVWDGWRWSGLGTGLSQTNSRVLGETLLVLGDQVLVGGTFSHAGEIPSHNFAIWHPQGPLSLMARRVGERISLEWPTGLTDFVLETSPSLHSSDWSVVQPTSLGMHSVAADPSLSNAFFRLRCP